MCACVLSPISISNCKSHHVPLLSLLPPSPSSSLHREVFDFLSQWRISRTSRGSGRSGELPSRQTSHLSCTPLIRVHYLYALILWFSLAPLSAKLYSACSANESNRTDWLISVLFFFFFFSTSLLQKPLDLNSKPLHNYHTIGFH